MVSSDFKGELSKEYYDGKDALLISSYVYPEEVLVEEKRD